MPKCGRNSPSLDYSRRRRGTVYSDSADHGSPPPDYPIPQRSILSSGKAAAPHASTADYFQNRAGAVFTAIVILGPIASISVFGVTSWLPSILLSLALLMSCWTYRRIATGGPEHLKLAVALSAVGFAATAAFIHYRLHA